MRRWCHLLAALFLLLSCRGSIHELDGDLCNLRVRTESDAGARTVVPDFSKAFDTLTVSLTSNDGYAPPAPRTDSAAPWQVAFAIRPGSWNITVVAKKAGVQVGSGSATVSLTSGLVDPVIVPLSFAPTAATGDVSFAVSFPSGLGIDYVHGLIEETEDEFVPVLTTSGGRRSGSFEFSGLAPSLPEDAYTLVLTFKRGGASGTVAGVFREKIIVVGGYTSGSWVGPNGELLSERAFSEDEFFSPEAALSGLSISGGVFPAASFSPATLVYTLSAISGLPSPVTFTATGSIGGQYLEYAWSEGAFAEIRSGTTSPAQSTDTFNVLEVRVTAADRATSNTYRVNFAKAGGTYSQTVPGGTISYTPSGNSITVTGFSSSPTDVTLPATIAGYPVTTLGTHSLWNCPSLTSLVLPNTLTVIGEGSIQNCTSLTSVVIPDSVTSIGIYAFYGSSALTSIVIPNSVTAIGEYAFHGCSSLASVAMSNAVTTIGTAVFCGTALTSVTIPSTVTAIRDRAFESSSLKLVDIPSSVNAIGATAFANCASLAAVHVRAATPPSVTTNSFSGNAAGRIIYVPMASVSAYQAASGWSAYAANIVGE